MPTFVTTSTGLVGPGCGGCSILTPTCGVTAASVSTAGIGSGSSSMTGVHGGSSGGLSLGMGLSGSHTGMLICSSPGGGNVANSTVTVTAPGIGSPVSTSGCSGNVDGVVFSTMGGSPLSTTIGDAGRCSRSACEPTPVSSAGHFFLPGPPCSSPGPNLAMCSNGGPVPGGGVVTVSASGLPGNSGSPLVHLGQQHQQQQHFVATATGASGQCFIAPTSFTNHNRLPLVHAAGLPNGTTFSTGLGSPMGGFTLTRLFNGTMTAMPHPHVSPSTIHQTPGGPGQLPLSLSGHIPGTAGLTLPAFSTGGANLSPSSSTPNTASNATFSFSPSPSLMPPVSAALIGPAGSAHSGLTAISSFSPAQLQPSMTGLLIPATLGKPTMPSSVFTAALPVNIGNNSNTMNAPQTGLTRLAPSPVGGRPRQTVTSNKRDSIPPSANTAELLRRLDDQIGILQRMASRTALQNTRLTQLVDVRAQLLKASSTSYSSPPASSSNPSSSSAPSPSSFNTTSDTILRDAMPLGPRMLPTGPVGPSVSVASPAMTSPCGAPGKPASAQARQNTCVGLVMAQTPVTASVGNIGFKEFVNWFHRKPKEYCRGVKTAGLYEKVLGSPSSDFEEPRRELLALLGRHNLLPTNGVIGGSGEETFVVEFRLNEQRYHLRLTRQQKTDIERLLFTTHAKRQAEILSVLQREQARCTVLPNPSSTSNISDQSSSGPASSGLSLLHSGIMGPARASGQATLMAAPGGMAQYQLLAHPHQQQQMPISVGQTAPGLRLFQPPQLPNALTSIATPGLNGNSGSIRGLTENAVGRSLAVCSGDHHAPGFLAPTSAACMNPCATQGLSLHPSQPGPSVMTALVSPVLTASPAFSTSPGVTLQPLAAAQITCTTSTASCSSSTMGTASFNPAFMSNPSLRVSRPIQGASPSGIGHCAGSANVMVPCSNAGPGPLCSNSVSAGGPLFVSSAPGCHQLSCVTTGPTTLLQPATLLPLHAATGPQLTQSQPGGQIGTGPHGGALLATGPSGSTHFRLSTPQGVPISSQLGLNSHLQMTSTGSLLSAPQGAVRATQSVGGGHTMPLVAATFPTAGHKLLPASPVGQAAACGLAVAGPATHTMIVAQSGTTGCAAGAFLHPTVQTVSPGPTAVVVSSAGLSSQVSPTTSTLLVSSGHVATIATHHPHSYQGHSQQHQQHGIVQSHHPGSLSQATALQQISSLSTSPHSILTTNIATGGGVNASVSSCVQAAATSGFPQTNAPPLLRAIGPATTAISGGAAVIGQIPSTPLLVPVGQVTPGAGNGTSAVRQIAITIPQANRLNRMRRLITADLNKAVVFSSKLPSVAVTSDTPCTTSSPHTVSTSCLSKTTSIHTNTNVRGINMSAGSESMIDNASGSLTSSDLPVVKPIETINTETEEQIPNYLPTCLEMLEALVPIHVYQDLDNSSQAMAKVEAILDRTFNILNKKKHELLSSLDAIFFKYRMNGMESSGSEDRLLCSRIALDLEQDLFTREKTVFLDGLASFQVSGGDLGPLTDLQARLRTSLASSTATAADTESAVASGSDVPVSAAADTKCLASSDTPSLGMGSGIFGVTTSSTTNPLNNGLSANSTTGNCNSSNASVLSATSTSTPGSFSLTSSSLGNTIFSTLNSNPGSSSLVTSETGMMSTSILNETYHGTIDPAAEFSLLEDQIRRRRRRREKRRQIRLARFAAALLARRPQPNCLADHLSPPWSLLLAPLAHHLPCPLSFDQATGTAEFAHLCLPDLPPFVNHDLKASTVLEHTGEMTEIENDKKKENENGNLDRSESCLIKSGVSFVSEGLKQEKIEQPETKICISSLVTSDLETATSLPNVISLDPTVLKQFDAESEESKLDTHVGCDNPSSETSFDRHLNLSDGMKIESPIQPKDEVEIEKLLTFKDADREDVEKTNIRRQIKAGEKEGEGEREEDEDNDDDEEEELSAIPDEIDEDEEDEELLNDLLLGLRRAPSLHRSGLNLTHRSHTEGTVRLSGFPAQVTGQLGLIPDYVDEDEEVEEDVDGVEEEDREVHLGPGLRGVSLEVENCTTRTNDLSRVDLLTTSSKTFSHFDEEIDLPQSSISMTSQAVLASQIMPRRNEASDVASDDDVDDYDDVNAAAARLDGLSSSLSHTKPSTLVRQLSKQRSAAPTSPGSSISLTSVPPVSQRLWDQYRPFRIADFSDTTLETDEDIKRIGKSLMTEIIEPTSSGLSGESGQIRPPSTSPTHHPDLKSLAHTFIDGSQSRSGTPYCQNEKVSADLRLSASEFAESIPEEIEEDDEVEEITGESRKCYKTDDWEVDRSTEIDAMGGDGGMLEEGEELYREKESLEEDCLKSELRPVLERRRREVMVARQQGVLLDRGHEIVRAFSMVGNDIELKELHRFPSNALSNSGKRPAHFSCRKQPTLFSDGPSALKSMRLLALGSSGVSRGHRSKLEVGDVGLTGVKLQHSEDPDLDAAIRSILGPTG